MNENKTIIYKSGNNCYSDGKWLFFFFNHSSLLKILLGPAHSVVKADAAAYTENIAAAGADSRAP